MSASSPVSSGNILIIPSPSSANALKKATITWSQSMSGRSADYYLGLVDVKDTGKKVLVFIEHNKYKSVGGDTYELPVSGSLQYGQKNDKGEGRFVVYHDNSYKVYQHRFTRAAIETLVLGQAAIQVGIALGYMPEDGTNGVIKNMLSGAENALKVFGEYLHSF
ncbi:hypothetical protein RSOLAG1IB_06743 [Rhizoctonia solani AG-1 IB]|uniref:Uncharacterized protein n=1 Tax=Thanatephorus cucumeris (strain AG1-IB / isolate 7/3/14) TaxID=1108050 RepID=M5CFJ5_THACB|nr:hypothetical protein BN14_12250 [Rhizoctonia solani AG-1 IB]CEL53960.1 hypothetical protein RSOLAG1IB_06743 [Rhizoctonia solani AG-1 IB]